MNIITLNIILDLIINHQITLYVFTLYQLMITAKESYYTNQIVLKFCYSFPVLTSLCRRFTMIVIFDFL